MIELNNDELQREVLEIKKHAGGNTWNYYISNVSQQDVQNLFAVYPHITGDYFCHDEFQSLKLEEIEEKYLKQHPNKYLKSDLNVMTTPVDGEKQLRCLVFFISTMRKL